MIVNVIKKNNMTNSVSIAIYEIEKMYQSHTMKLKSVHNF